MSWGSVIGAGIGAMTGRRDNKQAAKAARREFDWEQEMAEDQFLRQRELQEDSQKFEAEQASTAMQFSERMASTQHQREIKDLYAAGLNPILSGTGGMGAAAPSGVAGHSSAGSAAKGNAPKQTVFPTAQAVIAGAATGAQIEKTMAETKLMEAQADEVRARTPTHEENIRQTRAATDKIMADTRVSEALEGKTKAEVDKIREELNLVLAQIRETHLRGESHIQSTATGKALAGLYSEQSGLTGVERRTMEGIEKLDMNELLKAAPALAPIIHLIKPLLVRGLK